MKKELFFLHFLHYSRRHDLGVKSMISLICRHELDSHMEQFFHENEREQVSEEVTRDAIVDESFHCQSQTSFCKLSWINLTNDHVFNEIMIFTF